jgi:glucose uptake protein
LEDQVKASFATMYVPQNVAAYVFAAVNMCGWGLWGNVLKGAPGRVRWQNFYVSYILGIFLLTLLNCFTAGEVTTDVDVYGDRTFTGDDFNASIGAMAIALLAGVVWNVGNILLTVCINQLGLAISFGIIIGMGFVGGTILTKYITPSGTEDDSNTAMLWDGILIGGIATVGFAAMNHMKDREAQLEGKAVDETDGAPSEASAKQDGGPSMCLLYVLCVVSGICTALWSLIFNFAAYAPVYHEDGLSPWGSAFWFNIGCIISTMICIPLSLRFPIDGKESISFGEWWGEMKTAPAAAHLLSLLGGAIWGIGFLGFTLTSKSSTMTPAISYALGQCATLVAILGGVFWGEFKGTSLRIKLFTAVDVLLFIGAIVTLAASK